jgi:tRNA-Thr(GGU) m(6)t(6)A37 methyltransferase TsaA
MGRSEQIELRAIGTVSSPLTHLRSAPKQGDEGAPAATIVLTPEFVEGLAGVEPGDALLVLTWLDRGARDVISVHPRGDLTRPRQGVFATRSPDRPNPIGLHRVKIVSIEGTTITVSDLEAIDGTPVLDIKPVLEPRGER